ncbi:hypothetical protein ABX111_26850 (plasmid) [Klebsiella pneumoniae]|uniref:hypothetical protein n=1 Tax=Klebsiella pneumoniae TaxID=573 RepID=UPI00344EE18E
MSARPAGSGKVTPLEATDGAENPRTYPMPVSALICFCTCPDADSAERIATALVADSGRKKVNLRKYEWFNRWQR